MHGLDQSQAVTEAAKLLSEARAAVEFAKSEGASYDNPEQAQADIARLKDLRTAARAQYDAAYKAYTNPFRVEKTFS